MRENRNIRVNSEADQEGVRKAAKLAREVLQIAASKVAPGVTTDEIDKVVFEEAIKRDCYPSPLGYHGYPKSVCTSVNEVICHGIPDQRPLQDGDIINLDVTLFHHGFHGDLNATYPVGQRHGGRRLDAAHQDGTRVPRCSIAICGPGQPYAEIGRVIQPLAESKGCAVVKRYTGHGISRAFHSARRCTTTAPKRPMASCRSATSLPSSPCSTGAQSGAISRGPDDWTVSTVDGARSAAAEETLLIVENRRRDPDGRGRQPLHRHPDARNAREEVKRKRKAEADVDDSDNVQ
ncbi:hypothetical protein L7F22_033949 [Adiantum nelumboides]|nr:hypothetical protein [Adiantum nelumboides]